MSDKDHIQAFQRYWKRHKAFPTSAKLCEVVGMFSTASVFGMVGRLTDAGHLQRLDGRIAPGRRFFSRPLIGRVRAGVSQPEPLADEEALTLDDYLIDQPDRTTFHRVHSNSMTGALIADGELAVVEHNTPTRPGDIVLAVFDGEMTVKTLRLDDAGAFFLEAANPCPCAHPPELVARSPGCRRERRERCTEVTN